MRFKNSIKLMFSNFSLFWRVIICKLFALLITFLLILPIGKVLLESFKTANFFETLYQFCINTVLINPTKLVLNFNVLLKSFVNGLSILWLASPVSLIYLCVLLFIVMPFLLKLCDLPAQEFVYGYMSSLTHNSFAHSYVSKFGKSAQYSIIRTLMQLPVVALILFCLYKLVPLVEVSSILSIVIPIVMIFAIILIIAIYTTFFSGIAPAMVVFNCKVSTGIKKGFKAVIREYFKILSNFWVIITISTLLLILFGGFAVILVIPFTSMFIYVFQMVMFFQSQGMRYYVDLETIITPRKLEKCDAMKQMKDLV